MRTYANRNGIALKKRYGQHFLRDINVLGTILSSVKFGPDVSVFEIGGGGGALTRAILEQQLARLWVFEIDREWVGQLRQIPDRRLTVYEQDFLTVKPGLFEPHGQWTMLANLPYQITFPVLHWLVINRHLLRESVIMVQEEVAQKLLGKGGRTYGFVSVYFQWFFKWRMLTKVSPRAFYPPPKVFSRLLYFQPRLDAPEIERQEEFWLFVKVCFKQPRRTLRNNLISTSYDASVLDDKTLSLRAQQMKESDFVRVWRLLIGMSAPKI